MIRMPHWPVPPWQKNIKTDLEPFSKLLHALGNPHLRLPPVIHIAGTNGKGSSVAMLKSIFEAANYKVHTYTSPHLIEVNERIILRGEKISDDYLFEVLERTRLAAASINYFPHFFEGMTAAAFLAFSEIEADILLLETGIGGRLDVTNVVPSPYLTLITPISYDHMDYLGHTLSLIAKEKAGIIKPNVPCVISCQVDEVYNVLLNKCKELQAPAFCYEYNFGLKKTSNGFIYLSNSNNIEFPSPSLLGDHQLINAASVIAGTFLLNSHVKISLQQINQGLLNTIWPARIQKIDPQICARLFSSNTNIWLDGAHNNSGAQVLAEWAKNNLLSPIYLILGMTKKRNIREFCKAFKNIITQGYGVKVVSEASSYSGEEIAQEASQIGLHFSSSDSLGEAISIISSSSNEPANIIICGSLYLAADLFKIIN